MLSLVQGGASAFNVIGENWKGEGGKGIQLSGRRSDIAALSAIRGK